MTSFSYTSKYIYHIYVRNDVICSEQVCVNVYVSIVLNTYMHARMGARTHASMHSWLIQLRGSFLYQIKKLAARKTSHKLYNIWKSYHPRRLTTRFSSQRKACMPACTHACTYMSVLNTIYWRLCLPLVPSTTHPICHLVVGCIQRKSTDSLCEITQGWYLGKQPQLVSHWYVI